LVPELYDENRCPGKTCVAGPRPPISPPGIGHPVAALRPGPGAIPLAPGGLGEDGRWRRQVRPAAVLAPLPAASVFILQTNLRKYLETWPTPGSTTTEAWPEYVPEDGENRGLAVGCPRPASPPGSGGSCPQTRLLQMHPPHRPSMSPACRLQKSCPHLVQSSRYGSRQESHCRSRSSR